MQAFRYIRIWLTRWGLWPTSRLARIACYLLGVDLLLLSLQKLLALAHSSDGLGLGWWVRLLAICVAILFTILAYRWLKGRLLWRLRNRLIVTYVFIGVIPSCLLGFMALITLYFFAGQFAIFLVTSELNSRLRNVSAVNSAIANEMASRLELGEAATAASLEGMRKRDPGIAPRQVCAWKNTQPLPLCSGTDGVTPFAQPTFMGPQLNDIVADRGQLYLRAGRTLEVRGQKLMVVSSEPMDRALLEKIAVDLGEITLYAVGPAPPPSQKNPAQTKGSIIFSDDTKQGFTLHQGPGGTVVESGEGVLRPIFTAGVLPSSAGRMDRDITFATPLGVLDWSTGKNTTVGALVRVQTRPATLYARLFSQTEFATGIKYVLIFLFIAFTLIVMLALVIGTGLTRTVTRAIAQLYVATRHVNRGDFTHRIPVTSKDQLATLSDSFNSMTTSLEKLLEEQKEKQKLQNELLIAQEVQAQLFPQKISQLAMLEVYGFCRPARTVSGDYYDFLTVDSHRMVMAVGDVSGKGISAALLMATIHSAVRAYSLEGIPILREPEAIRTGGNGGHIALSNFQGVEVSTAALLSLLNHQLYQSTPAEKYATLFLSYYDGRERKLTYSNAGHLPPIVLSPNGSLRRLESGGTVIGLFDNVSYDESVVAFEDGEIFLGYSDGITEPENEYGEFGEQRLIDLVWENRNLALPRIAEVVTAAVDDWIGDHEQPDDVTLVLARAR